MSFQAPDFKNRNNPKNIALDPSVLDDRFTPVSKDPLVPDSVRFFFGDGALATWRHKAQEKWITGCIESRFGADFIFDSDEHKKILDGLCVELVESRPGDYANIDLNDKNKLNAARMYTRAAILRCQRGRRRRQINSERKGKTPLPVVSRVQWTTPRTQSQQDYNRAVWPGFFLRHVITRGNEREGWDLSLLYLAPPARRAQLTPHNLTEEMYESWGSKLQCRCDGVKVIEQKLVWFVVNGERTSKLLSWIDWPSHIFVNTIEGRREAWFEIDLPTPGSKRGPEENLSGPGTKAPRIDPPGTKSNLRSGESRDLYQKHSTNNGGKYSGNDSSTESRYRSMSSDSKRKRTGNNADSKRRHSGHNPIKKGKRSGKDPDNGGHIADPFDDDIQVMFNWRSAG
ncbi:MAG: hypothetical protein Q9160_002995 [Pyrenula sp. 1 TL-2023]